MLSRSSSIKRCIFGGSSAALVVINGGLCMSPAFAQTPAARASDVSIVTVEEVIVTATRREQSLQDVPVSLTAFTAENLTELGAEEMKNLSAPNFLFPQSYTSTRNYISVRGIFQESNTAAFETGFSAYMDGVYMGRNMSYNADVADIERVEILRGPQGTLYGKNTIAGVMNIVTRQPSDTFEGRLEAQLGNWNLVRLRGMANVPLVKDLLAARISVHSAQRDGYVDNVVAGGEKGNGIDTQSARGQLLFTPGDNFTMRTSVDYLKSSNAGYTWENATSGPLGDLRPYTNHSNVAPLEDKRDLGAAVTAEYRFDNEYKLTSISGYRKSRTRWLEDEDGSPIDSVSSDNRDEQELWSQEFRLTSPSDRRYDYVLGLYYFNQDAAYDLRVPLGPPAPLTVLYNATIDTTSAAAFAHANFHLTPALNIFGGARYTSETREFVGNRLIGPAGYDSPNFINPPVPQFVSEVDADKPSWTFGVQYDFAEHVMGYVSAADGFKSGGFNFRNGNTVKPEHLISYEAGLKTSFFEQRAALNIAVFYSDYDDLQVRTIDTVTRISTLRNAAKVHAEGFELELVARATNHLKLNLGVGYVESRFREFRDTTDFAGAVVDASGNRVPMTPPWTINAGAAHEYPLSVGGSLITNVDYTYVDDRYAALAAGSEDSRFALSSYGLLNGRLGYKSANDHWEVYVWGKNLLDEVSEIDRRPFVLDAANTFQFETFLEPRTYGVTFVASF